MRTENARQKAEDCGSDVLRRASDPARPRVTGHEPRVTPQGSRATACSHCVYARRPTGRWLKLILSRWLGLLLCTNHPDAQGDILGVPACSHCRNFRPKPEPVERIDVGDQRGLAVCTIPLTRKKVATVDAVDFERVNQFKWCADPVGLQWYAQRRANGRTIRMHQFIMNPPKGMVVDHANGNGLDNRRRGFEKPAFRHRNRVSERISQVHVVQQGERSESECTWFVKVRVKAKCFADITTPLS